MMVDSVKIIIFNMEIESNPNDLDYVMRLSYESLMLDIEKTLEEFIVFTDGDEVVELKGGTGERSQYIDTLIKYFENTEEFEKCKSLLDLKNIIIERGN